jgi:hypothetical protein
LLKDNYQSYAAGDVNALTVVGQDFLEQVSDSELYVNLYTGQAGSIIANSEVPTNTADVEIYTEIFNNGSQAVTEPFTVTFYKDAALTQVIDSVTVDPTVAGCARDSYVASVTWPDLPAGKHTYWVQLDSGNVIVEEKDSDNVASGLVLVDPQTNFLPTVLR